MSLKRYTKTVTITSIEDIDRVKSQLHELGWREPNWHDYQPWKNKTEKMIVYANRWHGNWSGYQKGYMMTMYR
jgi:hypothetical protein